MILAFAALGALVTVNGCLDRHDAAQYSAHATLNGRVDHIADQLETLERFDYLITGRSTLGTLDPRLRSKSLARINPWISSYSDSISSSWQTWQASPLDEGGPLIPMHWSHDRFGYAYQLRTDAEVDQHVDSIRRWIRRAFELYPTLRGVFIDDFAYDRFFWPASDETKREAWGDDYAEPSGRARLARFIRETEKAVTLEVYHGAGREGTLVVNGVGRMLGSTKRYAEAVGTNSETWHNIATDEGTHWRRFRPGDFLQANLIKADGSIDLADRIELARWAKLIVEQGAGVGSLGVTYRETPPGGGTIYTLPAGPYANPAKWPHYLKASIDAGGK